MANSLIDLLPAREPGLISMMYWVTHNWNYTNAFHSDDNAGMDFFSIQAKDARELISKIGQGPDQPESRPKAKELFETYLVPEFFDIWSAGAGAIALPPEQVPRGLVSFMYWVRHNRFYNHWFRGDALAATDRFGLAGDARWLIVDIAKLQQVPSEHPRAKERAKALFEHHLIDEVLRLKPKPTFW